ncbi:MAG: aminotransferase class V-fold PLP-dependent enzyme, partial [Cytophagales bacterium]|nr:aminotransferase class V-fold PLP-dependent enzyme [Cytophagales bacterium]
MSDKIFFTPGPAHLYPTVSTHIQTALKEDIGSISHRSKQFHGIYQHSAEQLRTLMGIPSGFQVLFLGSATEIWERSIESLVQKKSFHFVNGSFSKRYFEIAQLLQKDSQKIEATFGQGFNIETTQIPSDAELVCVTSNETSSGVYMPENEINEVKEKAPNSLLIVDAVSSVPYPKFDFTKVDSVLFSVQKAFGLPAGLGVWIVNDKCIEKANKLKASGKYSGTYHNLIALVDGAKKFETPATPNVLNMYLLGKVAEDMNRVGVEKLRSLTNQKAEMTYSFLEKSPTFEPFVKEITHRSPTVIVADCQLPAAEIIELGKKDGLVIGSGYGAF